MFTSRFFFRPTTVSATAAIAIGLLKATWLDLTNNNICDRLLLMRFTPSSVSIILSVWNGSNAQLTFVRRYITITCSAGYGSCDCSWRVQLQWCLTVHGPMCFTKNEAYFGSNSGSVHYTTLAIPLITKLYVRQEYLGKIYTVWCSMLPCFPFRFRNVSSAEPTCCKPVIIIIIIIIVIIIIRKDKFILP